MQRSTLDRVRQYVKDNDIAYIERFMQLLSEGDFFGEFCCFSENGQSIIDYAAALGHWDMLAIMVNKIKSNENDKWKLSSVLFKAIDADRPINEINLLIAKGADLRVNKEQKRPIRYAMSQNKWNIAIAIAKAKKTDTTDNYCYGNALIHSIFDGNYPAAMACLEGGAPTNRTVLDCGSTPLHLAIRKHSGEAELTFIKLLLQYNASLIATNKENQTAMQLAAYLKYWNVVNLIAKSKKSDAGDNAKYSDALFAAMKANRPVEEIVQLVAAGANLSAKNEDGHTPIQVARAIAVESQNWSYVKAIATTAKTTNGNEGFGDALVFAITHKQFDVALTLLASGKITVWYTDLEKNNPLHLAAKIPHENLIKNLLAANASMTNENNAGSTPIQSAASNYHWEGVKAIIKHYKGNKQDAARYGDVLRMAVISGEVEVVELLIGANAERNWSSIQTGDTCIHAAVRTNNETMLAVLLKHQFEIDLTNKDGQTPIVLACMLGHWKCAELLSRERKILFKDNAQAGIAFLEAVNAGQLNVANYLMQSGASITERLLPSENSALHLAAEKGDLPAIKFLVKNNADQSAENSAGQTPIELASAREHWDCVQWLVENNNTKNPKNNKLIEDLHYEKALLNAIKAGNYAITKLLLEHGAPCSRWNSEFGNLALYWAVVKNNPDIVALLIVHGADPRIKNAKGEDTFNIAAKLQYINCLTNLSSVKQQKQLSENQIIKSGQLFQRLTENEIEGEGIPAAVLELEEYSRNILEIDLLHLKVQRESMQVAGTATEENLAQLSTVITTINTLLRYPSKIIDSNTLPPAIVESQHVKDYLIRKEAVINYVKFLKRYAKNLDQKILNTTWLVKPFSLKTLFGYEDWRPGIPWHMSGMRNLLARIFKAKSLQEICEAHGELITLLTQLTPNTENKGRRHDNTLELYQETLKELKSISFNVSALQPISIASKASTESFPAPVERDGATVMASSQLPPGLVVLPSENLYLIPMQQPALNNSSQQQFNYASAQPAPIYPVLSELSPEEIKAREIETREIEARKNEAREMEAREIDAREIAELEALSKQLPKVSYASLPPSYTSITSSSPNFFVPEETTQPVKSAAVKVTVAVP